MELIDQPPRLLVVNMFSLEFPILETPIQWSAKAKNSLVHPPAEVRLHSLESLIPLMKIQWLQKVKK
jgi:hypothetical protein